MGSLCKNSVRQEERTAMLSVDVGTPIFHRTRGVGRVVDIETRKWEEEDTRYLVVEMLAAGYTIRIPETSPDIRPVLTDPNIIFRTLRHQARSLPDNYKTRQAEIRDAVDSGEPERIAAAARDIRAYAESEDGSWTTGGKRLYERALKMLDAEVAASQDWNLPKARDTVRKALADNTVSTQAD
jgi:RNA polymerase-interacting CarD/CdnL/TRCF family regulator